MVKLNKKDKKILVSLDFNARAPLSEIAKKTGLSKQLVKYRINELENKKVLKGTYALLDIFKAGYGCYRIFLKFQNVTEKKEEKIINYIFKQKSVKRVIRIGGEWDLVFVVWTKNIAQLEKIMNNITRNFGRFIFNKYISIITLFSYFRYKYAYETDDFPSISISAQSDIIELDKIDQKLVELLNKDGRIPIISLAKKVKLCPVTVKKRIENLISKGVIKGFRIIVNEASLDYFNYWLYIRLKSLTSMRIYELIEFLKVHKNVLSIARAVEKTDLEINLFVKNPRELHDFVNDLKYNFPDLVRDYTWYALYEIT